MATNSDTKSKTERSLLDMIGEGEQEREEIIEFNRNATPETIISQLLTKESPKKIAVRIDKGDTYLATRILAPKYDLSKGYHKVERAMLITSVDDFTAHRPEYIEMELEELTRNVCADMYRDFIAHIPIHSSVRREPRKENRKTTRGIIHANTLIRRAKPELVAVTSKLVKTLEGLDNALYFVNNLQELRHLGSANTIISFYENPELEQQVRAKLNEGSLTPSQGFLYSVIKYHQNFLNSIVDANLPK